MVVRRGRGRDGVGLEAPAAAHRHPGMPFKRVKGFLMYLPGERGEGGGRVFGAFDGTEGTEGTVGWRSKAVMPDGLSQAGCGKRCGKRCGKDSRFASAHGVDV